MAITATNPTTISAVYDRWSFSLQTLSDGCVGYGETAPPGGAGVVLAVRAVKSRLLADGVTWERSPLSGDVRQFQLDPYAEAATDTSYAQALQGVVDAIGHFMAVKGIA